MGEIFGLQLSYFMLIISHLDSLFTKVLIKSSLIEFVVNKILIRINICLPDERTGYLNRGIS